MCVVGWLGHFPQFERNLVCIQGVTSVPFIADRLRNLHDHKNLGGWSELYTANQIAYFTLVDSLLHCLSLFHIV
jgi:hypothetical protein